MQKSSSEHLKHHSLISNKLFTVKEEFVHKSVTLNYANTSKYLQFHVEKNKMHFMCILFAHRCPPSLSSLNMSFAFKLHYHAKGGRNLMKLGWIHLS